MAKANKQIEHLKARAPRPACPHARTHGPPWCPPQGQPSQQGPLVLLLRWNCSKFVLVSIGGRPQQASKQRVWPSADNTWRDGGLGCSKLGSRAACRPAGLVARRGRSAERRGDGDRVGAAGALCDGLVLLADGALPRRQHFLRFLRSLWTGEPVETRKLARTNCFEPFLVPASHLGKALGWVCPCRPS